MKLLILYATTKGNSKAIAETVLQGLDDYMFEEKRFMAIDKYEKEKLVNEDIVIFVCSTYGKGSEPEMMSDFWKYLTREHLPGNYLSNIHFAVFGCGSSRAKKLFNAASKRLYRRLTQLGGIPINDCGFGDASHENGHYETFYPWMEDLKKNLEALGLVALHKVKKQYEYTIDFSNEDLLETDSTIRNNKIVDEFEVIKNKRVTPKDYFRDTRVIDLKSLDNLSYKPGDIIEIIPVNLKSEVNDAIIRLQWEEIADIPFTIKSNRNIELPEIWKSTQTLRNLLEKSLDIFGKPNLKMGRHLRFIYEDYLKNENSDKLSDIESYIKNCLDEKKSIFDILCEFPTKDLRIDEILEIIPTIKARSYSITSSRKVRGDNIIELIIGINKFTTGNNETRTGISSKWISTLQLNDKIYATVKSGSMKFDSYIDQPMIMICTGTGIATIRSYLQERIFHGQRENYLFYGYRNSKVDDYYMDELQKYSKEGYVNLYLAASRDPDEKIYVQNKLIENSKLIWDLITNKKAHIIVSGNAKTLPSSVKTALRDIYIEESNCSSEQASKTLQILEDDGIYQEACY